MRLTWRDAVASVFVGAAVIVYVLWAAGVAMTTVSSTGIGLFVFGSGWAACVTNQREMAAVCGVDRTRPAPTRVYVVAASIFGAMALIAGIATLFTGNEPLLLVLVGAVVAIWLLATTRHAFGSRTGIVDEPVVTKGSEFDAQGRGGSVRVPPHTGARAPDFGSTGPARVGRPG